MNSTRTGRLTFASLLTALSILSLWASTVFSTGSLALLGISTCLSSVVFSECGKKYGFLHYLATALLSLLLAPKSATLIAYVMLLGYYPLIKQIVGKYFLRAIVFTGVFILSFAIFKNWLLPDFDFKPYHYALGLAGGEIIFFIFDYALNCFNVFYKEKFSFLRK